MERKIFISRIKPPTASASKVINSRSTVRRSKSMTDLNSQSAIGSKLQLHKNVPPLKSTLTFKPPISGPSRFPLKPSENIKVAPSKRRGPDIDVEDPTKKKLPKPNKPPPYDYKARFTQLRESHSNLLQKYKETKQSLDESEGYAVTYKQLAKDLADLQNKYTIISSEKEKLQVNCCSLTTSLKNAETENERLLYEIKISNEHCQRLQETYKDTAAKNKVLQSELTSASSKIEEQLCLLLDYKREALTHDDLRRNLHNQIQDLKGTIRVFCRIRPSLPSENSRPLCNINCLDENTVEIKRSKENMNNITGKNTDSRLEFTFDKVFPGEVSQSIIFHELSQLVQSAVDGYHVCVFAYGQTGSGKTYTMQGQCTEVALGMIPRSVILIFDLLKYLHRQGWNYVVDCNFLEIYNETIRDLLNPHSKMQHDIHFNEGRGITVTNIESKTVRCAEELLQLIEIANRNRAIAVTNFNEHSSRSHAVTRINLSGYNNETSVSSKGSLNLVDLAGSESAKTSCSERLTETKNINKSLSMLQTVISALHSKENHIPYRNSKLTYLLQSSLCGNAKALMFVNIAPLDECYGESISSLRFAAKVKDVKTSAKRNKLYLKRD